jgi:hypothetical protein
VVSAYLKLFPKEIVPEFLYQKYKGKHLFFCNSNFFRFWTKSYWRTLSLALVLLDTEKELLQYNHPLNRLLQKNQSFHWSRECNDAFEQLKVMLTNSPILSYPTIDGTFVLDTDASGDCIGAVLSQCQEGQERVIAYASRTLSKSEKSYCVTKKETTDSLEAIY